ncbi:DNA polymerase IV [Amphritea sp. 1_MG-2023]|uniref:DNA polymerase IV n=1 Tax=Amphritea sp. 1_MG-2023 TaxID=3062670 RepID=UPI0026E146B3|nr:DNA polymerase IV [Amphritea sp. 1_MG-2023]MDO6562206.1 DNA polymerase IV [Amphritea sp. 1_MG-2023]
MTEQPLRKIIHCDCDCFFAAVEMRDNPSLQDIPLAIGGSSDRRGVISTCNYPARAFGIHSAMATAQALKLCPHLTVLPGNMEKYRQASAAIMSIYADYTDLIEPLSLDEAYLDVTDAKHHGGSATLMAQEIRQRVSDTVGITISAGVAPNKYIAKIASDWHKPDGLCVITPDKLEDFVLRLPVKKIVGVGKVTTAKLQQMGIENCADLRQLSLAQLVNRFGRFGKRLYELSRGIDERPVKTTRERKSISVEHTFAVDLPDLSCCVDKLPAMLSELELRFQKHAQQREVAGAVIKLKFADFTQTTVEQQSGECSLALYQHLCQEAWLRGRKAVRLIGVGYRLRPKNGQQVEQLKLLY